jgi:hypothetical protein
MEKWKKNVIIVFGYLENLIFSFAIFGWPALASMLRSQFVYYELCTNGTNNYKNSTIESIFTPLIKVRCDKLYIDFYIFSFL